MKKAIPALMALIALVAGACTTNSGSSTGGTSSVSGVGCPSNPKPLSIIVVFHAPPNNAFTSVIGNGIKQAALDLKCYGVTTQFIGTVTPDDLAGEVPLIAAAVVKHPDGIAVSLPDWSAEKTAIDQAHAAGIPVVALNGGVGDWQKVGALGFFGEDEYQAGVAHGLKLMASGAKDLVCINHAPGNTSTEARCQGEMSVFKANGLKAKEIPSSATDIAVIQGAITGALHADPGVDAVGGDGCPQPGPEITYSAFKSVGRADGSFHIGTYDVSAQCLQSIKSGHVDFTSSQSPFLQGYLAVWSLVMYIHFGVIPGGGVPVLTGPVFVDKNNISQVLQHVSDNTF